MLKNIKISRKVPAFVIVAALVGCIITGVISNQVFSSSYKDQLNEKLSALLAGRSAQLEDYLGSIKTDLSYIATNPTTLMATKAFAASWDALGGDREAYLQAQYIENNPNPTGQKEKLDYADDGSGYSEVHARFHPWYRQFLQERGYYDIFIFNMNGDLIYSVFKELDYATNMNTGEWKESDLANAFRVAAESSASAGDQFFFDFKPYAPSHGAPASFISTPILDNGQKIGVLVYQMPIERLNATMAVYEGLGASGETYLVGSDSLMRTNSRFAKEGESTILQRKVETTTVAEALAGNSGVKVIPDYRGVDVFSAYRPFDFMGIRWALVAEQDEAEVMKPVNDMIQKMIIWGVVTIAILGVIGVYMSKTITNPLEKVNAVLRDLAKGEEDVEVTQAEREDEVGDLAKSALVFRNNLKERQQLQLKQKEAEERAEIEKKEAMAKLADDFQGRVQGIISAVASASTELAQTAEQMTDSISQSSKMVEGASENSSKTSENVQSVASAAEEMSATTSEIASQINKSNSLVADSVSKVESADTHVKNLADASQKVKDVVSLISDISSQINLLALNATIESARAGEAGKGFAVVAGEVKNLAGQTDKSITEIEQVISEMGAASDNIIHSLEAIKSSVNDINEISGSISAAVEEQSATTNEIAANMQSAATGTQKISSNLTDVSSTAKQSQSSSEQVLAAARELSQQSERMDKEVQSFLAEIRQDIA